MAKLTAQQASDLAFDFLALAQTIGDFRHTHWNTLSKAENQKLSGLQWSVMHQGEDILAFSTTLVMDEVETSLARLRQATAQMKTTMQNLESIQKGIHLATLVVTLGGAILSKNPAAITKALNSLVSTVTS